MKKILTILLSSIVAVVALALNIQAASVSFNPGIVEFKVAPGDSVKTTLAVHGFSDRPYTLNLRVGSRLENGNVPQSWIGSAYLRLASRRGGSSSSSMDLYVSVPPDAMAGSYSGLIVPEDMRSSEPISTDGIIVDIEVTKCSGPPVFADIEILPENFWVPADKDVELDISGAVSVADGCQVTAGYTMESNNGLVQGDIKLNEDGSFNEKFMANISRSGKDKNGRVYTGRLFAVDEEGNMGTFGFHITVLHDKGKKTGQNK